MADIALEIADPKEEFVYDEAEAQRKQDLERDPTLHPQPPQNGRPKAHYGSYYWGNPNTDPGNFDRGVIAYADPTIRPATDALSSHMARHKWT
jgi:hypothetical protein